MALKAYVLNGPSTVIQVDGRDPNVSWQNHLDRTEGLRGGVDLVARVGTPVFAPTPGSWLHLPNNGTAGNSGEFGHDLNPGWDDVFSHLSRYVGKNGQHFEQGELIAFTGNTGGVAAHLHRHLLDPERNRQNPWHYFSETSALAGGTGTTINLKEIDMANSVIARADLTGSCYVWNQATGAVQAIPDVYHLGILERMMPVVHFAEENQFAFIRNTYGATLSDRVQASTGIEVAAITAPILSAVTAAIKAQGVTVDLDAIANAVNDDAAARLAS
jgi:hypothetical protein